MGHVMGILVSFPPWLLGAYTSHHTGGGQWEEGRDEWAVWCSMHVDI